MGGLVACGTVGPLDAGASEVGPAVGELEFENAHVAVREKEPVATSLGLSTDTKNTPPLLGGVKVTDDRVPDADPHAPLWLSLAASMLDPSLLYTTSRVSKVAPPHVVIVMGGWVGAGGTEMV